MWRRPSLHRKISLTVFLVILILFLITGFSIWRNQNRLLEVVIEDSMESSMAFVEGMLHNEAEKALALGTALSNSPALLQTIEDEDRQAAMDELIPVWESLREDFSVSVIHLRSPYDTSFLRVQDPDRYGDSTSRQAILDTGEEKTANLGFEEGAYGLGMRGWSPVFLGQEVAGTLEVNIDFSPDLLEEIREVIGDDLAVFLPEEEGFSLLEQTGNYAEEIDSEHLEEAGRGERPQGRKNDLAFSLMPVISYGGDLLAVVALFQDVSPYTGMILSEFFSLVLIILPIIVIGAFLIIFFLRSSLSPLEQISDWLKGLVEKGGGDLSREIKIASRDEIGLLSNWFNRFLDELNSMLYRIRESSNNVAASTSEISTGNQDLAQRTEEQASSLEEISATAEKTATKSREVTDKATETDKLAQKTGEIVERGQTSVQNANQTMGQIVEQSQEITDIISTVNDIAFQTNLLALNASVEAARAGEAGRGFAVVASEVRNLSHRVAQAAAEIDEKIKNSVDLMEKGQKGMNRTEKDLEEIVEKTNNTIEEIASVKSSAASQNEAIEELHKAVRELNQMTQQNASLVQEISAASDSVEDEASTLKGMVNNFKLKEQ